MQLTNEERLWLRKTCPYFPKEYLDWLMDFKLDSEKQVKLVFIEDDEGGYGDLDVTSTFFV